MHVRNLEKPGFALKEDPIDHSRPLTAVAGLTQRASEELQALDGKDLKGAPGTLAKSMICTGKLRACKTHLPRGKERALLGQGPKGPGIPKRAKLSKDELQLPRSGEKIQQ